MLTYCPPGESGPLDGRSGREAKKRIDGMNATRVHRPLYRYNTHHFTEAEPHAGLARLDVSSISAKAGDFTSIESRRSRVLGSFLSQSVIRRSGDDVTAKNKRHPPPSALTTRHPYRLPATHSVSHSVSQRQRGCPAAAAATADQRGGLRVESHPRRSEADLPEEKRRK